MWPKRCFGSNTFFYFYSIWFNLSLPLNCFANTIFTCVAEFWLRGYITVTYIDCFHRSCDSLTRLLREPVWISAALSHSNCDSNSTTFISLPIKTSYYISSQLKICTMVVYLIILNTSVSKSLLTTLIINIQRGSNIKFCIYFFDSTT